MDVRSGVDAARRHGELECTAWWSADERGVAFHAESRALRLPQGIGLPGRVWATVSRHGCATFVPTPISTRRRRPRFRPLRRRRYPGARRRRGDRGPRVLRAEAHAEDAHLIERLRRRCGAARGGDSAQACRAASPRRRRRPRRRSSRSGQTLSTHLGQPDMLERVTALAVRRDRVRLEHHVHVGRGRVTSCTLVASAGHRVRDLVTARRRDAGRGGGLRSGRRRARRVSSERSATAASPRGGRAPAPPARGCLRALRADPSRRHGHGLQIHGYRDAYRRLRRASSAGSRPGSPTRPRSRSPTRA